MKKMVLVVALFLIAMLSNGQELKNTSITRCDDLKTKPLKEWFRKNHSNIVLGFGEQSYSVLTSDNKYGYNLIEVFEKNDLPKEIKVKSYLIDATSINNSYEEHIIYLHREILIGNKKIIEIVDAYDNGVIDVDLINMTEVEYENFMNSYSTYRRPICFKTFDSCFKRLTTWDSLSQAACDFFPCNTIAYTCCVIASGEGYIQNQEGFIGVKNCSAVYKTNGIDYVKP